MFSLFALNFHWHSEFLDISCRSEKAGVYITCIGSMSYHIICTDGQFSTWIDPAACFIYIYFNSGSVLHCEAATLMLFLYLYYGVSTPSWFNPRFDPSPQGFLAPSLNYLSLCLLSSFLNLLFLLFNPPFFCDDYISPKILEEPSIFVRWHWESYWD